MDFTLTDEQRMLQDMVERLAKERHGFDVRRAAIEREQGFQRAFWRDLADAGVLTATLPESCGGLDAGPVAAFLVNRALGRGLVNSPWIPTITCAATLLARAGTARQRERWLGAIVAGESIVAFADGETIAQVALPGGSFRLEGGASLVAGGAWADLAIVTARIGDDAAVFGVPLDVPGVEARHFRTIDGASASELRFRGVDVAAGQRIGEGHDVRAILEKIRDEAIVALCADATGSMGALLDATVDYAKTRRQFGKAIGSFQALQHRMVDMLIAREQATSITHLAALRLEAEPAERRRAVSAAKALVGKSGRMVAQAAVQIHGGIGTTEELDVSHHFRRIEMFNLRFGSVDEHVRRYAEVM